MVASIRGVNLKSVRIGQGSTPEEGFTFKFHTEPETMQYYAQYQTNPYGFPADAIGGAMNQTDGAEDATYDNIYTCSISIADIVVQNFRNNTPTPFDEDFVVCMEVEIGSSIVDDADITPFVGLVGTNYTTVFDANRNVPDASIARYFADGNIEGFASGSTGASWTSGDKMGIVVLVAADEESRDQVTFYKNGVIQGSDTAGSDKSYRYFMAGFENALNPTPVPTNGVQIVPAPSEMTYLSAYESWLGTTANGINQYWVSGAGPVGATYSAPVTINNYRNVMLSIADVSQFTPQAGGAGNPNVTIEYKLGTDALVDTLVLGIQLIFGTADSSLDMLSQPGGMLYYGSDGTMGTYGLDVNLSPTAQTTFAGGDIIGLVWDITNISGQAFAVFKNGALVYATPYDDIYGNVGVKSISYASGLIS